jgi:predicted nucleic acid-binding protein
MLFAMAREHYCRLVTSRFALEEARRNLADKNPHALVRLKTLANWVHLCAEADATRMDRARSLGLADPMDVPILAAALDHADILVTGDMKHFGSWVNHKFGGVTIMGLAMALDLILSEKR